MPDKDKIELNQDQMAEVDALLRAGGDLHALSSALDKLDRDRRRGQSPSERYCEFRDAYREMAKAPPDSRERLAWEAANDIYRAKDVRPGSVYQDAALSNLSVMYGNEDYIGADLLPVLPVPAETGVWYTYGQGDRMSQDLYDTFGDRGEANEIVESRSTDTFSCAPYGLKNFISQNTIDQQESPLNEFMDATESLAELLHFKRETRAATLLCASANYGTNTAAVAAADRWDTSGGGDPISDIQTADAALWSGRGPGDKVAFSSLDVYNVLSRNQHIRDLYKYGGTAPGLATPAMIAGFFGFADYKVARVRQQTAKEGQTAVYGRVWSDVFGVVRVARSPSIRNASFGYTVTYQDGNVVTEFMPRQGIRGGWVVQNSMSYQHKVCAASTGYLITTPIN